MDFVDNNNIQKVQMQPEDYVYARNEDIKVYGKLVSMSTENVVADSEQIWDESLKKNQSDINSQTQSKFGEYLPLSGGKMTGTLNIDFTKGIRITEYDLSPRNTYIGNGSIRIEQLDGDTRSVAYKTEIDSNSITTTNATVAGKVKANGFLANKNGNNHTVWNTNGRSVDLINLLKHAAIYVDGGLERVGEGENVNNTTVIDNPDSIIFDDRTERFLARKNSLYYAHWKADISRNIAPPSRYGIETDNGVFPFDNQMYKFIDEDDLYIAICINGYCNMDRLTFEY